MAAPLDPYAHLKTLESCKEYYDQHGYVVVRGLVSPRLCDAASKAFREEVKPFDGFLYRQASAKPERHVLTPKGYMLNSLLNIHDLQGARFPAFRTAGLDTFTCAPMQEMVKALLGEPGRVVQSMYFEGNPQTWAHQDSYYLDGEPLGSMTAAWIALEDIAPGAGRFFVYPGSHRIDMVKNGGNFDVAFHHDRYKALVLEVIRKHGLECRAPALAKGDVLFWSSKTIHGSLPTTDPDRSRSSITAHFIRESGRFLQYETRARRLNLRMVNGMGIHHPKSQDHWLNRLLLNLEAAAPGPFQLAKKVAIKALTR